MTVTPLDVAALAAYREQGPPGLQVVQTMYLAKAPGGATGVALHQDTHYIRNEPDTLNSWLLDRLQRHRSRQRRYEMADRDGTTWTEAMHSHDIHAFTRDQVEMLQVPKGGGVFFTSLTVHGSYANRTSDRPRLAYATHYVRDDTWVFRRDLQDMVPA